MVVSYVQTSLPEALRVSVRRQWGEDLLHGVCITFDAGARFRRRAQSLDNLANLLLELTQLRDI